MRLFIAIDLNKEIKEKIAKLIEDLQKIGLEAKWVKEENLHLSLKFLGETDENKLQEIKNIITKTASKFSPIEVNIGSFGFFPNQNYPRVFFIGTDKEEEIKKIASTLEEKLESLGFQKENRFKSHITLARFRSTKNIDSLKKELKNISISEKLVISEISLFKSILKSPSPIYEKIFQVKLCG